MVLRLGSTGPDVLKLQKGLAALNFDSGVADGDYGPATESAVQDFQESVGLGADGVAGPVTLAKYNEALGQICVAEDYSIQQEAPTPEATQPVITWVKCPADALRGGYAFTVLRSDVAPAYNSLYAAVQTLSGVLTSAGGRRPLTTEASAASQSKSSMHYVGRAHDMAIPTGMVDPATDPFVIVEDGGKWIVWCRTGLAQPDLMAKSSELGVSAGDMTLDGVYVGGGQVQTKSVSAVVFNFTALAKKFGFHRISPRKAFRAKADVMAAEWWHFVCEEGLVTGESTFGGELLKVYSLEEAQKFVYWSEVKDYRWQVEWF